MTDRRKRTTLPRVAALAGVSASTEVGSLVEIDLESSRERDNPYLDVRVVAEFNGPGGELIRRDGFWDGGRTWRVRFAPTVPGRWTYRIQSDDPSDSGLNRGPGELPAVSSDSSSEYGRRGFLRVSDDGHHLAYADGTPFFWLADTHWRFVWERWDEANKPGWTSQFRGTVDRRVQQGFTVYQTNLMGFGRGWDTGTCWADGEPFRRLQPEYFQDVVDPRMHYLAECGLVNAFGIGWHQAVDVDPTGLARFAQYLVARYGALPIVWTLGGEVAGYDADLRQARIEGWRRVAQAIRDADDYGHPITAHLTNERPIATYYQDEEWLSFTLNQLGHGDLNLSADAYLDHFNNYPGHPIVEGESLYEGLTSVEPVGRRTVTATMVRQVAYRAFQSGCCGYSYGAQGCWNGAWDHGELATAWGDLPWYDGIDLQGATQLGYLRTFYESLDWSALRPAPELFSTTSGINTMFNRPAVAADLQRRTVVVYFGETYRHDDGTATIAGLEPGVEAELRWFDPRTGEWTDAALAAVDGAAVAVPLPPSDSGDWLALLRVVTIKRT